MVPFLLFVFLMILTHLFVQDSQVLAQDLRQLSRPDIWSLSGMMIVCGIGLIVSGIFVRFQQNFVQ